MQHVFICGAKGISNYGGYETFVQKLIECHENESSIQYHVACKANGEGCMDFENLNGIEDEVRDEKGELKSFMYKGAHCMTVKCPNIGPAQAIYYDRAALKMCIDYCEENDIESPIFYMLTCRIGPFISGLVKKIHEIGGAFFLNPDGHEWKRAKWAKPVRKYWKESEKLMVKHADLVVCDSVNIEKYIEQQYSKYNPKTTYIAYGSDLTPSKLADDDFKFVDWLSQHELTPGGYYLMVGRFVPENNFETVVREFMKSGTKRDLAMITTANDKLLKYLEDTYHISEDSRIKFVGTVYDAELLKKIREQAYGYIHGHSVGGTNPSLLEALGSTKLNMLYSVGFNREVAEDAAVYWSKKEGNLSTLIDKADNAGKLKINTLGERAKKRIKDAYSWEFIASRYKEIFTRSEE